MADQPGASAWQPVVSNHCGALVEGCQASLRCVDAFVTKLDAAAKRPKQQLQLHRIVERLKVAVHCSILFKSPYHYEALSAHTPSLVGKPGKPA